MRTCLWPDGTFRDGNGRVVGRSVNGSIVIDPKTVDAAILYNKAYSHRKGDAETICPDRKIIRRTGVWCLELSSESWEISDHIAELLSKIPVDKGAIDGSTGVETAFIDIFISDETQEEW